jgi:hypothetical protein
VREGERGKGREFAQPVDGMIVEEKKTFPPPHSRKTQTFTPKMDFFSMDWMSNKIRI